MSPFKANGNPRLNRLLRGELSAIETYHRVSKSTADEFDAIQLRDLLQDHIEAVRTLREHIMEHGSLPADSSGLWGSWAALVEGMAQLFGQTTALRALKAGEDHGVSEYERALDDDNLPVECKQLIRTSLLPMTQAHLGILDSMMIAN
jgi:hypothetical protein